MWKREIRKCGSEEMITGVLPSLVNQTYSRGDLDMCYLSLCTACDLYLAIQMTSFTFLHSIVQSMAGSRARLGTDSFGRMKGPKARSLD